MAREITEIVNSKETEREPSRAWLFDVDGVITNPEQKRITEPEVLDEIIKRLQSDEPVALVTGRSIDFMKERVIAPLIEKIADPGLLTNFLAMGEKGGVWITYGANGQVQEYTDQEISVPKNLQDEVRNLVETEFSDLMFYDGSKRTMISTEMKDGIKLESYHPKQLILDQMLRDLVDKHGLSESLEVDPTTIATDIQNKHVGKDFAARRVLSWLKEKKVKPQEIISFGDSPSDLEMAEETHRQGFMTKFVFVGDPQKLKDQKREFPIMTTYNRYGLGTVEYLKTS